jgi:hypothetical protein
MFLSFSWSNYFLFVAFVLFAYFIVIGFTCYRKDISRVLFKRKNALTEMEEAPVKPAVDLLFSVG